MPLQLEPPSASMVLYCLLRRQLPQGEDMHFALRKCKRGWAFPPTKLRNGESLYQALLRPMFEDLGVPHGEYFLENELPMLRNAQKSPRYQGLTDQWYLYPVDISLTDAGGQALQDSDREIEFCTLAEARQRVDEPNMLVILDYLEQQTSNLLTTPHAPTMEARANAWAAQNNTGMRVARHKDIRSILAAGNRAFNLRVADPYLSYQRQGLGFTWSFFTPRDKQDIHVHALPAVEIYGVMDGILRIWYKPMNEHGARTWQSVTLHAGDWAEVEPLHCHFAYWVTREGLGTIIKAAASGELSGVGKLGVTGKTTCDSGCPMKGHCAFHPEMLEAIEEYRKGWEEPDYGLM